MHSFVHFTWGKQIVPSVHLVYHFYSEDRPVSQVEAELIRKLLLYLGHVLIHK